MPLPEVHVAHASILLSRNCQVRNRELSVLDHFYKYIDLKYHMWVAKNSDSTSGQA